MDDVKLGKYQHSKSGKFYEVIGVARHSETMEELVVYKALYNAPEKNIKGGDMFVRPKGMFLENILFEGKPVPRFKFVGK